jgi:hypothetical protein
MEFLWFVENALIPEGNWRYSPWIIDYLLRVLDGVDMDERYPYNQYLRVMVDDFV